MLAWTSRFSALALVVELVAVAVLAGLGPEFPAGVGASAGWSFLSTHVFELTHALLGLLVLAQAVILTAVAQAKLVPAVILTGVVVAVASGAGYVSSGQPETALSLMTVGWLVSLTGAIVEAVRGRRRVRAGT
jgi:hypothetical protein